MKTNRIFAIARVLGAAAMMALALAACQPQEVSDTAAGVSRAEAHAICSTWALARNTKNLDLLDQIVAPDVVIHDPFSPVPITSLEQAKLQFMGGHAAFPDFSMRFDHIWVDGDHVIARWTITGTHEGPFGDLPATGKTMSVPGMSVMKITDGMIVEEATYFDLLSTFRKMGARLVVPEAS